MAGPLINAGSYAFTGAANPQGQFPSQGNYSGAGTPIPAVPINQNLSFGQNLTFGTSSGQANLYVLQPRTLALSTAETLDLYGHTTPLAGIDGGTCLFLHIKVLLVWILSGGDTTGLTIGNAGSNPWLGNLGGTTPTITCYPGVSGATGFAVCMANEPVTGIVVSSTHGQLLVTNNSSTAAVNYVIAIAGTTT